MSNTNTFAQENFDAVDFVEESKVNPPTFDSKELVSFDDYCQYRVFTSASIKSSLKLDSVDLTQLHGTDQTLYSDETFGNTLRNRLKRITRIKEEVKINPYYYYDDEPKENIDFIAIGSELFVGAGKHRALGFLYLAHYHPSVYVEGPKISGVWVKRLVEVADFTDAMEEYKTLLNDHPQLLVDFPKSNSRLNNSMPILRNWQKNTRHQFASVREFRQCMESLRKTNSLKRFLGIQFHWLF